MPGVGGGGGLRPKSASRNVSSVVSVFVTFSGVVSSEPVRRGDHDPVPAGRQFLEPVVAVAGGGDRLDRRLVGAVAVEVALEGDGDAAQTRFAGLLDAVAVDVGEDPVADGVGADVAEVEVEVRLRRRASSNAGPAVLRLPAGRRRCAPRPAGRR